MDGTPIIIGIDEAGRGPLAGPVVAAAVVLGKRAPGGLADSKTLSHQRRAELDARIRASCFWALGVAGPREIEQCNILTATLNAMTQAAARLCALLGEPVREVRIDGNITPEGRVEGWRWPARAIVAGDASEPAISAASILAKQYRDGVMIAAARQHPHYGWERNKGYGTAEHRAALREYGPSPLHRQTFAPVAQAQLL